MTNPRATVTPTKARQKVLASTEPSERHLAAFMPKAQIETLLTEGSVTYSTEAFITAAKADKTFMNNKFTKRTGKGVPVDAAMLRSRYQPSWTMYGTHGDERMFTFKRPNDQGEGGNMVSTIDPEAGEVTFTLAGPIRTDNIPLSMAKVVAGLDLADVTEVAQPSVAAMQAALAATEATDEEE